jgi:hypothetical protein
LQLERHGLGTKVLGLSKGTIIHAAELLLCRLSKLKRRPFLGNCNWHSPVKSVIIFELDAYVQWVVLISEKTMLEGLVYGYNAADNASYVSYVGVVYWMRCCRDWCMDMACRAMSMRHRTYATSFPTYKVTEGCSELLVPRAHFSALPSYHICNTFGSDQ